MHCFCLSCEKLMWKSFTGILWERHFHTSTITHINSGWREAVNSILLQYCCASERGGCRANNMLIIPVKETRAEVAALLFPDMGNCHTTSPPCVCILLRLREIIVHGQDWLLEKDKTLQLRRREGKKAHFLAHHQVYFIQLLSGRRYWVGT